MFYSTPACRQLIVVQIFKADSQSVKPFREERVVGRKIEKGRVAFRQERLVSGRRLIRAVPIGTKIISLVFYLQIVPVGTNKPLYKIWVTIRQVQHTILNITNYGN